MTSDSLECNYVAGSSTDVRACGRFVVNQAASTAGGVDQKMREVNVGLPVGGGTAKLMDEREVEIGDRIRVLTSAGSWQTRTVDSVTYDNYQVTGFVVSEPFESESVSVGAAIRRPRSQVMCSTKALMMLEQRSPWVTSLD